MMSHQSRRFKEFQLSYERVAQAKLQIATAPKAAPAISSPQSRKLKNPKNFSLKKALKEVMALRKKVSVEITTRAAETQIGLLIPELLKKLKKRQFMRILKILRPSLSKG